jgi:DNA helicase-2/ATP-dependent DNA helicase PcrA
MWKMMDFSKFNPEQQEAITLPIDPKVIDTVLIIAGAGSGKTRVIIHRIDYLQEHGVSHKAILGLTFTKKAANEMQTRLNAISKTGAPVKLSTFHALASDLLRTFRTGSFDIIDDADQTRMIRALITDMELKDTVKLKEFKSWLSYQRNKCNDPCAPNIKDKPEITEFRNVARAYRKAKSHIGPGVLDFDDLLEELIMLLKSEPGVQKQLHARWKYILVDEYQDTNRLQFNILNLLKGRDTQLLQVGDEDQLIYSWRGAEIEHILKAYNRSQDDSTVRCVTLNKNYRCSGNILTLANEVVSVNVHRSGKHLDATKEPGAPVNVNAYFNDTEEADAIACELLNWEADGVSFDETAVLIRTNRMSRMLERALINRSIPYYVYNGVALFDSREVKLMMALLRFTEDPSETFYFQQLLDVVKMGVGAATIKKLDKRRIEANEDWITFLSKDPKMSNNQRVKELLMFFGDPKSHCNDGNIADAARSWLHNWDLMQFFKEEERESKNETLLIFFQVMDDYMHSAQLRGVKGSVIDFQEQRLLNDDLLDQNEGGAVHIMTIHKSKGLEFRRGFIMGMQDGVFPMHPDDGNEEDVRLAYVAITRFMERLIITRTERRVGFDTFGYSSLLDPHKNTLEAKGAVVYAKK